MSRQTRRAAAASEPDAVTLTDARLDRETTPDSPRGVNLILPAGSFHFLTGAAGAGKSALLAAIGLRAPLEFGRLRLFGQDATRPSRPALAALRRRIGFADEGGELHSHLTLFEAVALPLRLVGANRVEADRHVDELLTWTGLKPKAALTLDRLSGSERRLAALARAVVLRPELLLIDQESMGARAQALIASLHQTGVTVLVAGREPGLGEHFGARRLRIESGRILDEGA